MEAMCDFVCLIKSGQDNGAVNGEAVASGERDIWTDAAIDEFVTLEASGAMRLAPLGIGEKCTACVSSFDSLMAIVHRLLRFHLSISSVACACCICSLLHSIIISFHFGGLYVTDTPFLCTFI